MVDYVGLRKNVEDLTSKMANLVVPKDPSEKVVDGVTWNKPTLKDFTGKSWDKLTAKEKGNIAKHYGYSPKIPPDNFTDLKLPHHRASDSAAVGNGVRNALSRLPQTKGISEDEKARIKSHLNHHMKKIDDVSKQSEEVEPAEAEEKKDEDNMKNGVFTIPIIGVVGWDITAEGINKQLEKADGQDVVFEIASPGGSVYEGIEIFNAIRNYEGKTTAKIVGMAASMASYIPLATTKVFAEDNAVYMIHNAWTIAIGDSEELKAESEILESINETLARAYVTKTGKGEKEVLKMMSDETWLFGDEIKKEGFVDEMIDHSKDEKKDDKSHGKSDKDGTLAEAKVKVKDMFLKLQNDRMKVDIDKIKQKAKGGLSKMSKDKNYVSKLTSENIEAVKVVLEDLKKLSGEKEIKADDVKKIAQELEAAIITSNVVTPPVEGEVQPTVQPTEETKETKEEKKDEKDKPEETKEEEGDTNKDKEETKEDEGEEKKDDPKEEGDKEPEKEEKKEEEKEEEKEEGTSKQSEIGKAYKKVAGEAVSKLTEVNKLYNLEREKNETLTKDNISLTEHISKLRAESHKDLVSNVVEELSKFKDMDDKLKKSKTDELSKMGDAALEIMKAEFTEMNVSKLEEEEANDTQPSQNLGGKEQGKEDESVSKMKEDIDAALNRY